MNLNPYVWTCLGGGIDRGEGGGGFGNMALPVFKLDFSKPLNSSAEVKILLLLLFLYLIILVD